MVLMNDAYDEWMVSDSVLQFFTYFLHISNENTLGVLEVYSTFHNTFTCYMIWNKQIR